MKSNKLYFDFLIIGGGIQGCSAGFFLSKRKQKVALIEKDVIGRHASGANAGGVRTLGRDTSEIPLSIASMDWWNEIETLLSIKNSFFKSRYIKVAQNNEDVSKAHNRILDLNKKGFTHEKWLSKSELKNFLPKISSHCIGGISVEGDGWAYPWKIVRGLANKSLSQGLQIFEKTCAKNFVKEKDYWEVTTTAGKFYAQNILNCSGAWGGELAKILGEQELPIKSYAPMLAITDPQPKFLNSVIGILNAPLSLKQIDTGQLIIGGGIKGKASTENNETKINPYGLKNTIQNAISVFPHIDNVRIIRSWSGIEGYFPDNLPVIGPGSKEGVVHAFGFSAHGFQLGLAVGEALADMSMKMQTKIKLDAFSIRRFKSF